MMDTDKINYRDADIKCCYTCQHMEEDFDWDMNCLKHCDQYVDITSICDDYEKEE